MKSPVAEKPNAQNIAVTATSYSARDSSGVDPKREDRTREFPLVSIGVPTYNSNKTVLKALESILAQGYPNLEIIISDNCSTDATQSICGKLVKEHPSIRYFRQAQNIGIVQNFNFVLRKSSGDFFMWLADDDTLEPGILVQYVDFLMNNSDYSLVSGRIRYWLGDHSPFCEKDFNMENDFGYARSVRYYFKVVHGAMYHGLMRRRLAAQIPMEKRIGSDWHFVATLAYLGKVKNLDCIGYNKRLNGSSKNFKQYAKIVGDSKFSATFPHMKIAIDAFSDIMYNSPVYAGMAGIPRLLFAMACVAGIMTYYIKEFPFIIAGKAKRFVMKAWRMPIIYNLYTCFCMTWRVSEQLVETHLPL